MEDLHKNLIDGEWVGGEGIPNINPSNTNEVVGLYARANSDDLGSKAAGGDLGWMGKGAIPGPFDDAAFALQSGQISNPVKDDSGWHVIWVREIKSGQQQSFEQVRETLVREESETSRERAFNDFSAKLVDRVYKNPTTLTEPAKAMNLPVLKLDGVTRNAAANTGIGANAAVIRAAFSDARIQDNTVSDPAALTAMQQGAAGVAP